MTKTSRISCWIAAAMVLATGAATASDLPMQCTTSGGGWTVTATGPFNATSLCPPSAESCTGMTYTMVANRGETPDHVAITVEHDAPIVIPPSTFDTAPCAGDNVTGLAFRDCSNQTARINQNLQKTGPFDLVVQGSLAPVGGSIVVKKGKVVEQCRIASLGVPGPFDTHEQAAITQTWKFKGCTLTIPSDPVTGNPGPATVSGPGCKLLTDGAPVSSLHVTVNGQDVGDTQFFGDTNFGTGTNSCSTRTVSGRVYSMCDCKTLPPDPRPPC